MKIVIGIDSGSNRTQVHDDIQQHFLSLGIGVYYPQVSYTKGFSQNISKQWNCESNILEWTEDAISEVIKFQNVTDSPIFHYGKYYWGDRIPLQKSPNPGAFAFCNIGQDSLPLENMTEYFHKIYNVLTEKGITRPWFLIDEPPHPVDGDPSKYGWSESVHARIIKFATALYNSGFYVGVCYANPQSYLYWLQFLQPHRVILNSKYPVTAWGPLTNLDVWLYNKQDGFSGLASQMRSMNATGYLHFSFEGFVRQNSVNIVPLAVIDNNGEWSVTQYLDNLMVEAALFDSIDIDPEISYEFMNAAKNVLSRQAHIAIEQDDPVFLAIAAAGYYPITKRTAATISGESYWLQLAERPGNPQRVYYAPIDFSRPTKFFS